MGEEGVGGGGGPVEDEGGGAGWLADEADVTLPFSSKPYALPRAPLHRCLRRRLLLADVLFAAQYYATK